MARSPGILSLSRRRLIRMLALAFAMVVTMGQPSLAAEPPKRILFVGNSYTGQVKAMVSKLFAASPHAEIKLEFITPGGRTLKQHLNNTGTLQKIAEGKWDLVVLQDQSQTPAVFPDKFLDASKELNRLIEKAGAKTAYYQTWGRRDGDKANARLFPTYAKMQDALSKSYQKAAKRDGAILVPVGEAWRAVREVQPELGEQLYKRDGSHPSAKGAYLAACCFYVALTGSDLRDLAFDGGLPSDEAKFLRELASEASAR